MSAVAFQMAAHCSLDSAPLLSTAFPHAPGRFLGFLPPRYSSWEVGGVVSCPFRHEQGKHSNVINDHKLGASYATFQALFLLVGITDEITTGRGRRWRQLHRREWEDSSSCAPRGGGLLQEAQHCLGRLSRQDSGGALHDRPASPFFHEADSSWTPTQGPRAQAVTEHLKGAPSELGCAANI